jgi:hypothetical protein
MSSFDELCSNAVQQLGAAAISSLDDNTARARRAKAIYQDVRDAVTRDAKWNFAMTRTQLSSSVADPSFGWTKQVALPENPYCLRVIQAYSGDEPISHAVEGRKLMSDYGSVNLLYLARVTDSAQFDSMFIEAFEARLAAELALPITGSRTVAGDFWQIYNQKIRNARAIDAQEGTPPQIQATSLVSVRSTGRSIQEESLRITIP